VLDWTSTRANA